MSFFPSLPDDADLPRILGLNPHAKRALISAEHAVYSRASRLTTADRELVGAYASALNAEAQGLPPSIAAGLFSIDAALICSLIEDPDRAPVARGLVPLLAYVRKATLTPLLLDPADARSVLAEGWTERDLQDCALIAALSVFVNHLQQACGIAATPALFDAPDAAVVASLGCPLPLQWML